MSLRLRAEPPSQCPAPLSRQYGHCVRRCLRTRRADFGAPRRIGSTSMRNAADRLHARSARAFAPAPRSVEAWELLSLKRPRMRRRRREHRRTRAVGLSLQRGCHVSSEPIRQPANDLIAFDISKQSPEQIAKLFARWKQQRKQLQASEPRHRPPHLKPVPPIVHGSAGKRKKRRRHQSPAPNPAARSTTAHPSRRCLRRASRPWRSACGIRMPDWRSSGGRMRRAAGRGPSGSWRAPPPSSR